MAMVVQHNMQAMNSNRVLGGTTAAQAKATEKLSSGFRINRAADDAAGLTISEKMRKQIRGLGRASKNAQDGISAVQTAEGALTEVHSMLHRMEELSTQAANGTNSKKDRDAIQSEISQLTTEIDRVSETTMFNETCLLKGDHTKPEKQKYLSAHDAGLEGTLVDNGDGTATFTMNKLQVGDQVKIGGKDYTIGDTKDEVKKAVNKAVNKAMNNNGTAAYIPKPEDVITVNGVKYTYYKKAKNANGQDFADGFYTLNPKATQEVKGRTVDEMFKEGSDITANGKTFHILDDQTVQAKGITADGIDDNNTSIISAGEAYMLAEKELKAANSIGDTESHDAVGFIDAANQNKLMPHELNKPTNDPNKFTINVALTKVPETLSFNLHVGADADMSNKIGISIDAMNSNFLGIKGLNVSDDSGMAATYAIDAIGDALSRVSAQRSSLGAIQNRLEHTISNLDNITENTTAAESRIRDTDMAAEMVEYSKNNILKQAGTSMLAQANQSTQSVMTLLQG